MKHTRNLALAALACSAALAGPAEASHIFKADLTGGEEVPPIATTASGEFAMRIESGETSITFVLTINGMESTTSAAHIHFGQADVNGGIMAFLCGGGNRPACPATSGTVISSITASDIIGPASQGIAANDLAEAIAMIRAGRAYVNVHSATFPNGEIRGQVR